MRRRRGPFVIILVVVSLFCPGAFAEESVSTVPPRAFEEEIRFIEELRGVDFPQAVTHREIRRSELREFLRSTFARDLPVTAREYFEVLRTLHLIDSELDDPLELLLDLYVGQVLAFYDPIDDVFYSLDEPPADSPDLTTAAFERAITIHELVHALQDQRFGAGEVLAATIDDWDRSLAYHALIEGEATLVMLAVLLEDLGGSLDDALADDQIIAALGEAAALDLAKDGVPSYFVESLKFPYVEGLSYAIDLYREGGWEALERAHQTPPASTEQIYDREPPGLMCPLDLEGALLETTLGEFHWRFLLGRDATDGWESDRVALVRGEGGLHVIAATRWSSKISAAKFAGDYEAFLREAGREPLVRVEETSVIVAYGPDPALSEALMEHELNLGIANEEETIVDE